MLLIISPICIVKEKEKTFVYSISSFKQGH